jgi:hypothetical protein
MTQAPTERALSHHSRPEDLWLEVQVLRDENRELKQKLADAERKSAGASQSAGTAAGSLKKALRDKVIVAWGPGLRCNQCSEDWVGEKEVHTQECLAAP